MSPLLQRTRLFVERKLVPWPEFLAAIVVGSVATGEARPDSDVDCIFVFDRLDERIVPAEFVWHPEPDVVSTIFEVDVDTRFDKSSTIVAHNENLVNSDVIQQRLPEREVTFYSTSDTGRSSPLRLPRQDGPGRSV